MGEAGPDPHHTPVKRSWVQAGWNDPDRGAVATGRMEWSVLPDWGCRRSLPMKKEASKPGQQSV